MADNEKKEGKNNKKPEEKVEEKKEEVKQEIEAKVEEMKTEEKIEAKVEKKKKEEIKEKKDKAVVNGNDLGISKKHSMAICDFIRGRKIEEVIPELEQVVKLKKAIPMKGEIPHRKGKIMSGRYPVNASRVFIKLLKNLNANSSVNGLENPIIAVAVANDAARPFKRGGRERFKRTNIVLIAKEKQEKIKQETGEKK